MELKANMRALQFVKKMLLGDTQNILPFPTRVQKPVPQQRPCVPLPRSEPAQQGVPAAALDTFLRTLAEAPHANVHHALVLRKGAVICEGHCAPYAQQYWHISHSLCKTLTGTAIGMLVDDGVLRTEELLCDIFPERCSLLTGKRIRAVTVKHLLTMRTGVNFREMGSVLEADWLGGFMASDFLFEPGSAFNYNSMNSYVLSAIVTKKTGKTLFDFLQTRLFEPLGFGSVAWEMCPQGLTKGGWGLYLLPEDLAKVGQLYLQNGRWGDRQLVSAQWVQEATKPDSIHENGEEYGWHIWTHSADGSYMMNGMFGQYVWVMPALEMVVAVNAGSGNLFTHGPTAAAIAQLFAHVHKAAAAPPCPEQQAAREQQALQFTLEHLRFRTSVPVLPQQAKTPWHKKLAAAFVRPVDIAHLPGEEHLPQPCHEAAGQRYDFGPNNAGLLPFIASAMCDYYSKGVTSISFCKEEDSFSVHWTEGEVVHVLPIGFEQPALCELNFAGNIFVVGVSGVFTTDEDEHTVLKLELNLLESTSTRLIKCFFLPQGLRLQLEETPEIGYVVELLQRTNPDFLKINTGVLKDVDYLQYRFERFCSPTLLGKTPEENAPAL